MSGEQENASKPAEEAGRPGNEEEIARREMLAIVAEKQRRRERELEERVRLWEARLAQAAVVVPVAAAGHGGAAAPAAHGGGGGAAAGHYLPRSEAFSVLSHSHLCFLATPNPRPPDSLPIDEDERGGGYRRTMWMQVIELIPSLSRLHEEELALPSNNAGILHSADMECSTL
ncbi:unnamed protein product [Linum tenue]|uniref:Uncharacterized protein n=1 Tax=Linum tenue TaxID=586396 RepID=A0AAV0QEC3_9ROSI|nr:unnamed protein product [Linum tenue]